MNPDKINIDELLKQSFDDFAPDAPDVWHGIEQGISQATVTASSVTVQAHSWLVKMMVTAFTATIVSTVGDTYCPGVIFTMPSSALVLVLGDGLLLANADETELIVA